ncbi:set domain-containing protein [Ophiostoma piceae UAMH 11346]|uniref:Set domain-containing protein n=1 Tax=Ophiostoma piceae (strain UAMH 11346) TaxID=1262450 RepID=S3CA60_OPHP1|nr:set domain-containing protein [Ophiostoma piceae UAMH 11346]
MKSLTTHPASTAYSLVAALTALGHAAHAHDLLSGQFPLGICQKASPSPELQICSQDGTAISSIGSHGSSGPLGKNTSDAVAPLSHISIWSQATPCYQNASREASPEFCVFTSPTFADSHGITLVTTSKRAAHFSQKPAFVQPDTVRGTNRDIVFETEHGRDADLPALKYRIEAMPAKGYGVVATQPILRGDLIMSTTASILFDYQVYDELSEDVSRKLQAAGIDSLPELHRARYMNLSTHDGAESTHEATVSKILNTNAFDIDSDDDGPYGFFAVFPEISRFNHDCRPNSDYYFDHDTLTQYVHAVRPIAAGEEITVSYIDLIQTRKQRLRKLKSSWGFPCSCSLCTQSDALSKASDARIAQIHELRVDLQDYTESSRATPEMAELLVSLYQQERMDAMIYEAYSYAAIEWNGAGEPWTAIKYARLAIEYGMLSVGSWDAEVDDMRQMATDPWTHWSWLLRKTKRMQWGKKGDQQNAKSGQGKP